MKPIRLYFVTYSVLWALWQMQQNSYTGDNAGPTETIFSWSLVFRLPTIMSASNNNVLPSMSDPWWEKIFLTFSKYVKLLQRIFLILRRHRKSGNTLHAGVWKTPSTMSPPTIDRVPQTGEPAENVLTGVPPTVRYYDAFWKLWFKPILAYKRLFRFWAVSSDFEKKG